MHAFYKACTSAISSRIAWFLFAPGGRTPEQLALVGAAADVAARAAFHHEDNKCHIVDSALAAALIGGLSPPLLPPGSDGSCAAPATLAASAVNSEN